MRTTSALVGLAAIAAGTVGAARAYDVASPPQPPAQVGASTPTTAKAVAKRPRLVMAPCRPPAALRKGVCVTDVVRTVVLPALPAPAATPQTPVPSAPVQPAANPGTPARGDEADHEDEVEHEDDAEHEGDGEDDHEDDHEDDEHEGS